MYRSVIVAITALSLSTSVVSPALASDVDEVFQNQTGAKAGFYLRVPFSGGLKPSDDTDLQYGLRMGYSQSNATGYSFTGPRQQFNANMIDLKFTSFGFNSLNLGGQKLVDHQGQWLGAAEGEGGGMSNLYLILGGFAAVALGVVALSGGEEEVIYCPYGEVVNGRCYMAPVID